MIHYETANKIENIISGKIITWQADSCTAARNYLCASFSPSTTVKKDFNRKQVIKKEQAAALIDYATQHKLWVERPTQANRFLTQGGEAEVFLSTDQQHVIKLNDGIYYATWLDFLNSILIHNLLFEETSYTLIGFTKREDDLQIVLKQQFVISDAPVQLNEVKEFLEFNEFVNTKGNDYFNKKLSLILEDIHDENVIMNNGIMFFIDTVFYVNKES